MNRRWIAALLLIVGTAGHSGAGPRPGARVPIDEPAGHGPDAARGRALPARATGTQSVANARINDPAQAPPGATDLTPAIAAIGNRVLIVWRVTGATATQRLRASWSEDGGATWTDSGWLPALPGDWRWGVDPCVQADPVTNTFFIAAQAVSPATTQHGIWFVTAQIDGGIQWGAPSLVRETAWGGFYWVNQLHMNYDRTYQWLDLVYHDGFASPPALTHQYSTNRGASWSAPATVVSDPAGLLGLNPQVAMTTYWGPLLGSADVANWDQITLPTRRWDGLGGFHPPLTAGAYRADGASLPGTFDRVNGTSLAVDRTFNRFAGKVYAAWVASCGFATWPTPFGATQAEVEPNDTPAQANVLSSTAGWFSGTSSSGDLDCLRLVVDEHWRVVVRATSIVSAGSPLVEPTLEIEVVAPDGVHTLGSTPFPIDEMANAEMLFTAPRQQAYTFRIRGVNVLSYEISLAVAGPPNGGLDRRDLYVNHSNDAGYSWGFPGMIGFDPPGFDVANPTLVVGNDGRPYLMWQDWSQGDPDGALMSVRVTRSSDGGLTWETPQTLSTAYTDWTNVPGSGFETGWRIGAATTPMDLGEGAPPEVAGRTARAAGATRGAAALPEDRVHFAWTDGRDGEGNIYTAGFSTGFEIPYRTVDTVATPGEFLGLRMCMINHNALFTLWLDTETPTCQRNWSAIHGTMWVDPGQTLSTWPYVVVVPDTAAPGTVFFQGSIDLGPTSHGINTFIHVQPSVGVPDGPLPLAFAAPAPNPAATHSAFRFSLPAADAIALEVFDVSGARVRTLASGRFEPGSHARGWDLRDDAGRRVAAGVYLARLTIGNWTRTQRIAVVR